eukprot:Tbor_TRINITY_DN5848_c3_g1::TRINITY_DN5848_c3_g1_i3::g.6182::m.6182
MAATILEASASYNPAFLGAPLDPCAGPHKPPNMLDPFMTRYDYDYNKEVPPSLFALREKESGFSKNRPLFGRPPTDDWDSVEHRTYIDLRKTRGIGMIPNENELRKLFITSVEPHLLSTAYIRGQRSKVGCPHGDPTTISTYKDHYPQKWTALASGPYAGKNANTYNPNLLSIDTPEDDGVGKPVKRGRARTADGINNNNNNNNNINANNLPSCFPKTLVNISKLPRVIIDLSESRMNRVPELYTTHDAFVLPTRGEGWGLPLMEAMAMGLPAIATDWGGQVEFMKRKPSGTGGDPNTSYEYYSLLVYNEGLEDLTKEKFQMNPYDWVNDNYLLSDHYSINNPNTEVSQVSNSKDNNIFNMRHFWRPKLTSLHIDESSILQRYNNREIEERVMGRRGYCSPQSSENIKSKSEYKSAKSKVYEAQRYGRWATPSVEHLAMHMQWVRNYPEEGVKLGVKAREHIVNYYSGNSVAKVIAKRMEDIVMEGFGRPLAA